ncbi:MAG: hypothetical protein ABW140_19400, partial [Candidatus Sedimenticola sp. 6PFRAG1]
IVLEGSMIYQCLKDKTSGLPADPPGKEKPAHPWAGFLHHPDMGLLPCQVPSGCCSLRRSPYLL